MRIAIASEKGLVSEHFGHTELFTIYTLENKKPVFVELLKNPEHKHGYLPIFLKNALIDVVICGGIGQSAVQLMVDGGMDVLSGAEGFVEDIIAQYANDELISKNVQCSGHNHDHECHHDSE